MLETLVAIVVVVCAVGASTDVGRLHVRRFALLDLPRFSSARDDSSGRSFRLELGELWPTSKTRTVRVNPEPSPVDSATRFVVIEGHPGRVTSDEPASAYAGPIYAGGIVEDPTASVVGTFRDGVFEGVVQFRDPDQSLHVQPHVDVDAGGKRSGFNALAYWSTDVLTEPQVGSKSVPESRWFPLPAAVADSVRRPKTVQIDTTDFVHLCNLSVIADPHFIANFVDNNSTSAFEVVARYLFYADLYFRNADLDGDGHRDGYGFRLTKIIARLTSASDQPTDDLAWHPDAVLADMFDNVVTFKHYCVGLLFTYRMMDKDESQGITQLKVDLSHDVRRRGFCSKAYEGEVPSPNASIADFTSRTTNALPVNFYYQGGKAGMALSIASIVHQLGHLMNARDDAETKNATCRSSDDHGHFFMDTPIREANLSRSRFSPCSLHDMRVAIRQKRKTDSYCIFDCVRTPNGDPYDCATSIYLGRSTLEPLTTVGRKRPSGDEDDEYEDDDDYDDRYDSGSPHLHRAPYVLVFAFAYFGSCLVWGSV